MSNNIRTKLYSTGFLTVESNNLRVKQGLPSQTISNLCFHNTKDEFLQNLPDFKVIDKNLYPVKQNTINYKLDTVSGIIPDNSSCLEHLNSV
jgi:hypothetical protein